MHRSFLKSFVFAVVAAFAVAISPFALAQGIVSSALTGSLLDNSGKPVGGAAVTVVHVPTNTTYTAITNPSGRFRVSGLRVGGPYTVSAKADGYEVRSLSDVYAELAQDVDVTLNARSETIQLDKFVVTGGHRRP